jgi:small subunit ribosomal protein S11
MASEKINDNKPKVKKKKRKISIVNGIAHIHATVNNTIVNITDVKGNTVA